MTDAHVLSGIEFARTGGDGSRPLLLDLYLPASGNGAAPRPAVVHFHGGGWRVGERSSLGPVLDGFGLSAFEKLTDAGFVVASADYRLSHEAVFPAQLHDAKAAVRWLRNHAADYNVDPARIYAWGDSAGGHLASLVGLTANAGSPDFANVDGADVDSAGVDGAGVDGAGVDSAGVDGAGAESSAADAGVAAVAAWYPPTDLVRMAEQSLPTAVARADDPGSREELLIGAVLADEPAKAAAASPISHASRSAPPFFLAHGTADRFVPPAQSESLAAALEGAGSAVELLLIEDADHMWILPDHSQAAAEKAMEATLSFFLRQSRSAETPAT